MQRIEADATGPQTGRELDQLLQVGEISHAPIARRSHAIELHCQDPGSVEIAMKCVRRRHDERHLFGELHGVSELQAIRADRQVIGPADAALMGGAFRHHLGLEGDFPVHRKRDGIGQFAPGALAEPRHHRRPKKTMRRPGRHGRDDDAERRLPGGAVDALAVKKFRLDAEFGGLGVKVHGHGARTQRPARREFVNWDGG